MSTNNRTKVPGVLFLYEDLLKPNASTLRENVEAFCKYSRFRWYPVNLLFGFPTNLEDVEFAACVTHYTLSPTGTWVSDRLRKYLQSCPETYKIAIFQDEFWYFAERERMLNDLGIDCLYSRHKPKHVRDVYRGELPVKTFHYYLAGYVSDELVERANRQAVPLRDRTIDVGYRGRRIPYYLGRAGQEKGEIADRFLELAGGRGLRLNLSATENERLYGASWDQFVASCRAMLGVEGGVSVIDLDGRFHRAYDELLARAPRATFAQFLEHVGEEFTKLEDRIDYRSVTPRHFEAAAFRTLQILFEGRYEGILLPNVHYVPLRKDFSNLDEVLAVLQDDARVEAITNRAYEDLIASGKYSSRLFVDTFDQRMAAASWVGQVSEEHDRLVKSIIADWERAQARIFQFEEMHRSLFNSGAALPFRTRIASAMVNMHRRRVEKRRLATSAIRRWGRWALDRGLWAQVERWIGKPVPARPEFDPTATQPRSPLERAFTAPATAWRMVRVFATALLRRLFKLDGR